MSGSSSRLVFSYITTDNRITDITDSVCDYEFKFEVSPEDMSTHQLFGVFEKVLAAMGYHENSIVRGACSLAFNEMRDTKLMVEMVREYELDELEEQLSAQEARRAAYNRKNEGEDESI